jgi:hypothetical protein
VRKGTLIIVGILVVILIFAFWLAKHKQTPEKPSASDSASSATAGTQTLAQSPQEESQSPTHKTISAIGDQSADPRTMNSNDFYQWWVTQGRVPIEFYGKVIDENSNAVSGAGVNFTWDEKPMGLEHKTHVTHTDSEGLFSLHNARGSILEVAVSKEGYYTPPPGSQGFSYAMEPRFSPDPLNPIVFKLKKKGQGVELITSDNGMRKNVAVRIPKDSVPVRVDLFQKQASPTGQLEISQNKPPWRDATNWSFSMSIPDGGLIEHSDEFPFAAPDTGYRPTISVQFEKSETNWTTHFTGNYYISVGEPRKYGWLHIESDIAQETVFLTYAINPSGSRNLEPAFSGQ